MKQCYLLAALLSIFTSMGVAQVNCFNINLDEVIRDPYDQNFITVHILNPESESINYPGIRIYNALTDELIGEESVNFFGIANESVHMVPITMEVVQAESYTLRIEIWSGFYENLECSFTDDFYLYPETFCTDSEIMVSLAGLEPGEDPFVLDISQNGESVFSDSFILDSENPMYYQEPGTCLGIGCYDVVLTTSDAVISSTGYILQEGGWYSGTESIPFQAGDIAIEFSFSIFECATNNLDESKANDLNIYPNPSNSTIILDWGNAVGQADLSIYDINGNLIQSIPVSGIRQELNVSKFSAGMYIAKIESSSLSFSRRFIVE